MYGNHVLLRSLNPLAVARGEDIPDAVTIDGVSLSRGDILGAATSVAERVAQAERLVVLATPSVKTVLAVVGCLIAGVTVVPVPPDAGPAEREHILRDSGAQAWLGEAPDDTAGLQVLPVRQHARSWHSYSDPHPSSIAFVLYTSGTTGPPKGVLLSRDAIAAGLDALAEAWQWTWKDTLVHGLPLFHVHGLILGLLGPLRVGSPVIHTGKPTPSLYAAAKGTLYFGVPTVWSRVAADPDSARALADARLLVSGSAPLPVPVFEKIRSLTGHAPVERYGMSETLITLSTRFDGERRPGSVGLPVNGVETRLTAEDGSVVPHDGESIGALQVRGPMLFDGYLNNPDATAESFTEDGWFDTGDVAVIEPDGFHRIVGRASTDLIKSGGYRVGAGEIETVLLGHASVDEVAVVGVPDDDLGQRIVAFVVGSGVDEQELIDLVASELSIHKRPREVRVVDSLPRNAMGKVQKKLLG
ncbi:acyl-CoA synthetase [Rhodococcus sp. BP-252]|uniref:acyl-CoA synthetase n=1 Tax=unclassified Rhodococcus (in: high G+C Gram-positive bacteria) TaxID=192944 RepID=UPI001C9B4BBC|nr:MULTISPECIES: acyl-CoA synthetase [unclassified Rhodococcus (in: high G+C Gram-positive bacteria)]MBY6411668.1 acyl-CoA synthetase [Rhodococcus sp. BP-320]MBY6417347.1 acyl-CoA synthetase [Rhodococcus sp. BP-321]MBY6421868.1 acyl-CoA synthetase [Rhodococcus sp. BP-324]MBY6427371.1 acyl-CoA synthetase [Rhodococcus sp. BP-323]MBY6432486.1 acyl-CoA synthetase [Rhodococcus sp. BP-322]